jgi:hypothetical protein
MKHKVFFCLLLKDLLSTRELLRRKHMDLDSYTCDLCLRKKVETVAHLFLRCNFAKACWNSIGVSVITSRPILQIFKLIKVKVICSFLYGGDYLNDMEHLDHKERVDVQQY